MREHELFSPLIDCVDELELIRWFFFSLIVKYGVFLKISAPFMIEIIAFRFWHLWLSGFSSKLWKSSNAFNWFTKFLHNHTKSNAFNWFGLRSGFFKCTFIIYLIKWTPSIQPHFAPNSRWSVRLTVIKSVFLVDLIKNARDFRVIKCAFVWMQTTRLSLVYHAR